MEWFYKKEYEDSKGRIYFLDNAKFLLIMFVVMAHFVSPLQYTNKPISTLWIFLNSFHMPAFIFISGYLAKSYIRKDKGIKVERLIHYIILYFACQMAVAGFERFVLGKEVDFSLFYARTSLWYLQCIIAWYLLLPIIHKFKPSVAIIGSILFSLIIGYDTTAGHFLSVQRVFNHMPYFLFGYYMNQEMLLKVKQKKFMIVGAAILAAMVVIYYFVPDFVPGKIITSNYAYEKCGLDISFSMVWIYRVFYLAVATLMIFSFFAIVPRGKTFFTKLGSRSLQVYIIHRFIYLSETKYEWWKYFDSTEGRIAMILVAIVGTFIMSWKYFSIPFDFIMKLDLRKLYKQDER